MISKLFKKQPAQETSEVAQSTELWAEVSTEQQETMKGGYPWPGFPPIGGGGGGSVAPNNGNGKTACSTRNF